MCVLTIMLGYQSSIFMKHFFPILKHITALTGLVRSPRSQCLRWHSREGPHPSTPSRRIRARHLWPRRVNLLATLGVRFGSWCRGPPCVVSHPGVSSPEGRKTTGDIHLRQLQQLQSMTTGNFFSFV